MHSVTKSRTDSKKARGEFKLMMEQLYSVMIKGRNEERKTAW